MSIDELIQEIDKRFISHNDIEVERATIRRWEWLDLKGHMEALEIDNLSLQAAISERNEAREENYGD